MNDRSTVIACALACSALLACSDEATSESSPRISEDAMVWGGQLFGSDVGAATTDAGDDVGVDASAPDVTGGGEFDCIGAECQDANAALCPGATGCACEQPADCDSGFCHETRAGKRCMDACVETCPTGQQCVQLSLSSGDVVYTCIAPDARLCSPCTTSAECNVPGATKARCLPQSDGSNACGTACTDDSNCLGGHACRAVADVAGQTSQQCVPVDPAGARTFCRCTANAVALGLQSPCVGKAQGPSGPLQCPGQQQCAEQGAGPVCNAQQPTTELCNGADDDCDGSLDEGACDDGNTCTLDACDPSAGCSAQALGDGTACDADGSVCTPDDACAAGLCKVGPPLNCDDGNPCTQAACDLAAGCTQTALDGAPCTDDNGCTVGDTCAAGACVPGPSKTCTAPGPCKLAACDATTGACIFPDKPDALACDDGDACTSGEVCSAGACIGAPTSCGDNNPCTDEACDPTSGCKFAPNTASCDDSNACTGPDVCVAGSCTSAPVLCDDGNPCTADGCDPVTGCTAKALADQAPCGGTTTWCVAGQCSPKPATGAVCAAASDCASGFCVDGVCCEGACAGGCESCLGALTGSTDGQCKPVKAGTDPANDCTEMPAATCGFTGQCDGKGACAKFPLGMPCSDAACVDATSLQQAGTCGVSGCSKGAVVACDDGNACTTGDVCKAGSCLPGVQQDCDDGNACTDDSCASAKGCLHTANAAPCEDGNVCTQDDACFAGSCKPGLGKSCNDDNPCTDDACDFQKGCIGIPNNKACDDGDACTVGDACASSTCKAGAPKDCSDGLACSVDSCKGGVCSHDTKACCQPTKTLFDFNGATPGWSFTNSAGSSKGWQIRTDAKQTKSAPGALYYGDPVLWNFNFGTSSGTALSPPFAVPVGGASKLTFWVYAAVEAGSSYDLLTASIVKAGAKTQVWSKSTTNTWVKVTIDVSAHAGSAIQLALDFKTVDSIANSTQGVFVDDVALEHTCP